MGKHKINYKEEEPYKSIINLLILAPIFDYKTYKKGLKTKEIRELIVEEYEISGKRYDSKSDKKFKEFKEYLLKNCSDKVKLNQSFKFENCPVYQGFNKYLANLEDDGWIKREDYVTLSKYKRIEPLRDWHKHIIKKCDNKKIIYVGNITYYFQDIEGSYFRADIDKLQKVAKKMDDIFQEFNEIYQDANKRKMNDIWRTFIDKLKIHVNVKIWLWIQLIALLSTPKIFEKFDLNKKNDFLVFQNNFLELLIEPAFYHFMDKIGRMKGTPTSFKERDDIMKRYRKFYGEILKIYFSMRQRHEKYIAVKESSLFSGGYLNKEGISYSLNSEEFSDNAVNFAKFVSPSSKENETIKSGGKSINRRRYPDFFSDSKLFKGFKEEMKNLGIDNVELIYQCMNEWANVFDAPIEFKNFD